MKRQQKLHIVAFIVVQCGLSVAQAQAQPARALIGATIIAPSKEPNQFVGTVVIADDRITQVGPIDSVRIPDGAERIDLTGKFLMPGLIDAHVHFIGEISAAGFAPASYATLLQVYPRWGVTSVLEAASDTESFARARQLGGERGTGRARYFGVGLAFNPPSNPQLTVDEARSGVEALKIAAVNAVKIFHANSTTLGLAFPAPLYSSDVLSAIVGESHRQSLPVLVHASGRQTAMDALSSGADALMHGIYDELVDDDFVAAMRQAGASYVPTQSLFELQADTNSWKHRLEAFDSRHSLAQEAFESFGTASDESLIRSLPLREKLQVSRENLRRILQAGIPIVMGTDSGFQPMVLGITSQMELALYVEAGLTAEQALATATINAAQMIGVFDELGSIDVGKYADIVVLSADPLADIRNIREIDAVYVGGVAIE